MEWFLYIAAVLFIAAGSFLVLNTEKAQEISMGVAEKGTRRAWGGSVCGFGVLLAIASFWSGVVWFLLLLGLLLGGMGAYMFLGEEEKVQPLLRTWSSISSRGLRMWGLILVVTGTAILSWV